MEIKLILFCALSDEALKRVSVCMLRNLKSVLLSGHFRYLVGPLFLFNYCSVKCFPPHGTNTPCIFCCTTYPTYQVSYFNRLFQMLLFTIAQHCVRIKHFLEICQTFNLPYLSSNGTCSQRSWRMVLKVKKCKANPRVPWERAHSKLRKELPHDGSGQTTPESLLWPASGFGLN